MTSYQHIDGYAVTGRHTVDHAQLSTSSGEYSRSTTNDAVDDSSANRSSYQIITTERSEGAAGSYSSWRDMTRQRNDQSEESKEYHETSGGYTSTADTESSLRISEDGAWNESYPAPDPSEPMVSSGGTWEGVSTSTSSYHRDASNAGYAEMAKAIAVLIAAMLLSGCTPDHDAADPRTEPNRSKGTAVSGGKSGTDPWTASAGHIFGVTVTRAISTQP